MMIILKKDGLPENVLMAGMQDLETGKIIAVTEGDSDFKPVYIGSVFARAVYVLKRARYIKRTLIVAGVFSDNKILKVIGVDDDITQEEKEEIIICAEIAKNAFKFLCEKFGDMMGDEKIVVFHWLPSGVLGEQCVSPFIVFKIQGGDDKEELERCFKLYYENVDEIITRAGEKLGCWEAS